MKVDEDQGASVACRAVGILVSWRNASRERGGHGGWNCSSGRFRWSGRRDRNSRDCRGGVAYAGTERLLAVGEFSYIPGGSQKISGVGFAAKASAGAYDFNGGIHFQFPLKEPKAVPYVAAGVGALHSSGSATTTVMGTTASTKASATDFYFNFGGGLRYYVSDRWGIRPELKIFAGDETFVRLAIGIFYQFGK